MPLALVMRATAPSSLSSCAGRAPRDACVAGTPLTRASTLIGHNWERSMDCRVTPGNDERRSIVRFDRNASSR